MFSYLIPLALLSLVFLPIGIPGALLNLLETDAARILFIFFFPLLSISIYTGLCIAFAQLGRKAIIPGRFPRKLDHLVYGRRRLYGTMWTAIYYFKPLYWLLLSNDLSKTLLLRGFGYRGPIRMTTYPDTWIRDLPLLELGEGSYLANKSTIGTNICMSDGTILVDRIKVGKNSVIGHLCMLAPGVTIGDHSETGSGSTIGMGVQLGNQVSIGPAALINHGARIADRVKIGTSSYVGIKAVINLEGAEIPPFASIPAYCIINTVDDLVAILEQQSLSDPRLRSPASKIQSGI